MKKTFCKMCLAWINKADAYKHWGKWFCERCSNEILEAEVAEAEADKCIDKKKGNE